MDFEYPAHFQAGIKYKVMPDLQVNFDVGWTDYKAWDKFKFEFDRQISALKIAKLLSEHVSDDSLALPLEFIVTVELGYWNRIFSHRSFKTACGL